MILNVDFINSDRDDKLENYILSLLKSKFTQSYIKSICVSIKRTTNKYFPFKLEIELNSKKGSFVHTQSEGEDSIIAISEAIKSLEKQVLKIRA